MSPGFSTPASHTPTHRRNSPLSDYHAKAIAQLVGGELIGPGDIQLDGVSDFDEAKPGQLTLIGDQRYADRWLQCPASAAVVTRGLNCPNDPKKAL